MTKAAVNTIETTTVFVVVLNSCSVGGSSWSNDFKWLSECYQNWKYKNSDGARLAKTKRKTHMMPKIRACQYTFIRNTNNMFPVICWNTSSKSKGNAKNAIWTDHLSEFGDSFVSNVVRRSMTWERLVARKSIHPNNVRQVITSHANKPPSTGSDDELLLAASTSVGFFVINR